MRQLLVPVTIDLEGDYLGDTDVTVSLDDESYDRLSSLVREYLGRGEELSEQAFCERLPDVYQSISGKVDDAVPDGIDLQDDEEMDDYGWSIQYPDDVCMILDEDEGWGIN